MIRINLLPPEILERRKWERYYPYVFVASAIVLGIVLVVWGFAFVLAGSKNETLQQVQSGAAEIQSRADKLAVFESKQQELVTRQKVADEALANRVDMGRLAEEVSLVLPSGVWLERLACDQSEGMHLDGYAPNPAGVTLADGYKAVALTLVRLTSLEPIVNVWLSEAGAEEFTQFQGVEGELSALSFSASAEITTTKVSDGSGQ